MSRRDTIIIAVLLNAGLLIVLFATSLKSDVITESSSMALAPAPIAAEFPKTEIVADEVDQTVKQYTPPAVTEAGFAADLQAIGAAEPAPAIEQESSFREVKVKKGDVLDRIARQNHVSVEEIMKVNHLSNSRLKIGQVLKIPSKEIRKVEAVAIAEPAQKFYTIKKGDNPWTIAVKNHMKVEELLKLNNLNEEKAKHLKAGDQIRIK